MIDKRRGSIAMSELTAFLESHGIFHSKKVTFEIDSYTVVSYRRDKDGRYMLSQDHPNEPIIDEETFVYGH
jgi:hypothetical protein